MSQMKILSLHPRDSWFSLLRENILDFLTSVAREYGDLVRVEIGKGGFVLANHPDFIRDILVSKARYFGKQGQLNKLGGLFGKGLLTSDGDYHKVQKKRMQPHFSPSALCTYTNDIIEVTNNFFGRWSSGGAIDVESELSSLTLEVLGKCLFGDDFSAIANSIREILNELLVTFEHNNAAFEPGETSKKMEGIRGYFDELLQKMIEERIVRLRTINPMVNKDFVMNLLTSRGQDIDGGLSDEQIKDEILTLIFAGHETTSGMLTWSIGLLAQYPELRAELLAEIEQFDHFDLTNIASLPMPCLESFMNESMRLFPPVWNITRKVIEDVELGGTLFHAGTVFFVSPFVTQRDPRFFIDPDVFKPSRWNQAKADGFSFFPFGTGFRRCIGAPFSLLESKIILTMILTQWDFTATEPLILSPKASMTLKMKERLFLQFNRRL